MQIINKIWKLLIYQNAYLLHIIFCLNKYMFRSWVAFYNRTSILTVISKEDYIKFIIPLFMQVHVLLLAANRHWFLFSALISFVRLLSVLNEANRIFSNNWSKKVPGFLLFHQCCFKFVKLKGCLDFISFAKE